MALCPSWSLRRPRNRRRRRGATHVRWAMRRRCDSDATSTSGRAQVVIPVGGTGTSSSVLRRRLRRDSLDVLLGAEHAQHRARWPSGARSDEARPAFFPQLLADRLEPRPTRPSRARHRQRDPRETPLIRKVGEADVDLPAPKARPADARPEGCRPPRDGGTTPPRSSPPRRPGTPRRQLSLSANGCRVPDCDRASGPYLAACA